jgi:uncharacterized small protein (DUF1192 family)
MAEEEAEPVRRPRGWAVVELAREDLELLAMADLEDRIVALETEIARTQAQMDKKRAGRAAADALFGKSG